MRGSGKAPRLIYGWGCASTPVNHLLSTFLHGHVFGPIVTREFRPPKPHPAGILHIASQWGLADGGNGLIMVITHTTYVTFHPLLTPPRYHPQSRPLCSSSLTQAQVGDSIDDMTAGFRAGAATVLLVNEVNAHLATHEHTDLCVKRLDELIPILEAGFEGEIGGGEEAADTRARAERALPEEAG